MSVQVERIAPSATAFTVVCAACAAAVSRPGWRGASFAGRLDLDLQFGMFLCRNGHSVRVERTESHRPAASEPATSEAA
jgi:hypothetical protein